MEEYTSEQINAVKRINSSTNYYDILNVDQDASDAAIKKSYKKLALLLHPDKNKAPGAIEAFKKLSSAAAVLTDERKRNEYDLCGTAASNPTNSNWFNSESPEQFFFTESNINNLFQSGSTNISPEDFFNMFSSSFAFTPFNQQSNIFTTNQRNFYQESDDHYNNDEHHETPQPRTERQTVNDRSLFRKLLDVIFIFLINWILNTLMRSPRR